MMRRMLLQSPLAHGPRLLTPAPNVCSIRHNIIVAPLNLKILEETKREPGRLLPSKSKKAPRHTLVLDLDETLLSSFLSSPDRYEDSYTLLRPHLIPFLREVTELFELVYWTAGSESYGRCAIKAIEEAGMELDGKPVAGEVAALFRQDTLRGINYMKFLGHLNRDVHNTLLIDDRERSFLYTPRHGVKCRPFNFWAVSPEADVYKLIRYRDELGRLLHSNGRAAPLKSFNLDAPIQSTATEDDELLRLLPMLRAVASSPHAAKELDHWRPKGYEKYDELRYEKFGFEFKECGVGSWETKRRAQPIPPLGKSFKEAYSKLPPKVLAVLGPLPVYKSTGRKNPRKD
jgi:hypothetical protein